MKYSAHSAAALFPMMSEPELADLSADIKANGLIHPIVLGTWDDDGEQVEGLIDGRNRQRACDSPAPSRPSPGSTDTRRWPTSSRATSSAAASPQARRRSPRR
jgi:hypothetical protein